MTASGGRAPSDGGESMSFQDSNPLGRSAAGGPGGPGGARGPGEGGRSDARLIGTFRAVASLFLVLLLAQSVTGSQLLGDVNSVRDTHQALGGITAAVSALLLAVAIVVWRRRGVARPMWQSLALLVGIVIEFWSGHTGTKALHVPLGIGLLAGGIAITVWAWRGLRQ